MDSTGQQGFDPRQIAQQIAEDDGASAMHRLRAVRLLLQSQPRRQRGQGADLRLGLDDAAIARAAELVTRWHAVPEAMPCIGEHRGFVIHAYQGADRIEAVIRPGLDRVLSVTDPLQLFALAGNVAEAPEIRLASAALYESQDEQRAARHKARLGRIDLLAALIAGLTVLGWHDPAIFASLLDTWRSGTDAPAARPPEFACQLQAAQNDCQR
jgi:hypothetical protein